MHGDMTAYVVSTRVHYPLMCIPVSRALVTKQATQGFHNQRAVGPWKEGIFIKVLFQYLNTSQHPEMQQFGITTSVKHYHVYTKLCEQHHKAVIWHQYISKALSCVYKAL